jgi:hypothetical protein
VFGDGLGDVPVHAGVVGGQRGHGRDGLIKPLRCALASSRQRSPREPQGGHTTPGRRRLALSDNVSHTSPRSRAQSYSTVRVGSHIPVCSVVYTLRYSVDAIVESSAMYAVIITVLLSTGFPTETYVMTPVTSEGCAAIKADIARKEAAPGYRRVVECTERPQLDTQLSAWSCSLLESSDDERAVHVYHYGCAGTP